VKVFPSVSALRYRSQSSYLSTVNLLQSHDGRPALAKKMVPKRYDQNQCLFPSFLVYAYELDRALRLSQGQH